MQKIVLVLILILLPQVSFAGFFDPNPQENFKEADYLIQVHRYLAADKLINDVIVFCNKKDDEPCLVDAYYYFGKLLTVAYSDSNKGHKILSYVEKDITTDNANQKGIEYYNKALDLAIKNNMNDRISSLNFRIALEQFNYLNDLTSACESLDKSLFYNLAYLKEHPDAKIILDPGYNSYKEYITEIKKRIACK